MKPQAQWSAFEEDDWQDNDLLSEPLPKERNDLWIMISRAITIYLGLTVGLGAFISFFGGDPLANNWFVPKLLLVIVGLAFLIALANSELQGQGQFLGSLLTGISRPKPRHVDKYPYK
ncbi:MAG: hypothetical protein AAF485_23175 [Chloroflexota bacterium]